MSLKSFIQKYQNSILVFICILVVFMILIMIRRHYNKNRGLVTVSNNGTSSSYTVAEAPDKEESIRLLAEIKSRLKYLIDYCIQQYPYHQNVQLLRQRFNPNNVQETSLYESGTSYTIDKGKELRLCLRNKPNRNKHHDINLLMFVAIHELSHIMSVTYGHNAEFQNNFKFLLEKGVECNVYSPQNYYIHPVEFCGITVNSTPLFSP